LVLLKSDQGEEYLLQEEANRQAQAVNVHSLKTISPAKQLAQFTGQQLRNDLGLISHLAIDRKELASILKVSPEELRHVYQTTSVAVRASLNGPLTAQKGSTLQRILADHFQNFPTTNTVLLTLNSPGGDLTASLTLLNYLSDLRQKNIEVIILIHGEVRSDAALIALAASQLYMTEGSLLGGEGAAYHVQEDLAEAKVALKKITDDQFRHWSLWQAMIENSLEIRRIKNLKTEVEYLLCKEEYELLRKNEFGQNHPLADQEGGTNFQSWDEGKPIEIRMGISAEKALSLRLVDKTFDSPGEIYNHLAISKEEVASVTPGWAHTLINALASDTLANFFLFIAFVSLMGELSAPGIGIPGFLSAISFGLFFWSRFLHGTSGWLEVMLFLLGLTCLLLEVFVLPGFGIFGLGGGALVLASLVLASQTFVLPSNSYQYQQLPRSLLTVVIAMGGFFLTMFVMRKYLHLAPWLGNMVTTPPSPEEGKELDYRETQAHFEHLLNKHGMTTTPLVPAGKARFGDEIVQVVSSGEMVSLGQPVYVTEIQGNRVVVASVLEENES
ncbi:MAG: hypothetical protein MPJ24_00915, partial [Pirellulaceae bacterium]|nr:hypothetical protein [Pirellulaceae bacterium]